MIGLKKIPVLIFLFIFSLLASHAQSSHAADCGEILLSREKDPETLFAKLYCHAQNKQYDEAEKIRKRIKGKLPEIKDYLLYYEAEAKFAGGRTSEAEKLFREILVSHPSSVLTSSVRERLAELLVKNERYDEAEKIYVRLISETESRWLKAVYLKNLGEIKEKRGSFREASEIFERIWEEHPEVSFSDYIFELHEKNGKTFSPKAAQYMKRGNVFFRNGNWSEALSAFSLGPKLRAVKTKTAICLYRLSRFEEALDIFSEIDSPKAVYWKGKTLQSLGRETEAISVFKLLHRLNPKSSYASKSLLQAAGLNHLAGRFEEAEKLYRLIMKNYSGRKEAAESAWKLGWIHYRNGEYKKAVSVFSSHAWEIRGPQRERFVYWYAKAAEKTGDKPGALFALGELADSPKLTYYSFLAKLRMKKKPLIEIPSSRAFAKNPFKQKSAAEKSLFFSRIGIYDFALKEAKALEAEAKTSAQRLYLAFLYQQAKDYRNSIKLADRLTSPKALSFSFPKGFEVLVKKFSREYGLDEFLVYSLIREESHFDKEARSVSDAMGLMQLLPTTARETAEKIGLQDFEISNLLSPEINIKLGSYYLAQLVQTYGENFAVSLAGYNGGPTSAKIWYEKNGSLPVDEFIEEISFKESRNYVKKIFRSYGAYEAIYGAEKDQLSRQSFEKFLKILSP